MSTITLALSILFSSVVLSLFVQRKLKRFSIGKKPISVLLALVNELTYYKVFRYNNPFKTFCKTLLIVLQLGLISLEAYAQNGQDIKSFNTKIIPPSPDAAGLGKYGNTPVGLHTGIPQIDIPLYTIKSKSLEVPISISYHAAGIKVNEMASWIGLGWSLNAGGVITRSAVGLADVGIGGFWNSTIKTASQITANDLDYVRAMANGQIDGESDYYFYNFTGHSGKFVYTQNDPNKPFLIPITPIRVTYTPQGWFEVRDETGTVYEFSAIEDISSSIDAGGTTTFASSYYLSKITSSDGSDNIFFTYISDQTYSEDSRTDTETIQQQCAGGVTRNTGNANSPRQITPLRLDEIRFSTGKVKFVKNTDIEGAAEREDADISRLQEIEIYSKKSDGNYSLRKRFALGVGYFQSAPDPNGYIEKRLKLTSVTEKAATGNSIKSHSFSYNETTILPHRKSFAQDWWGFYNGQTGNTTLLAGESVFFEGSYYTIIGGNREPNETAMQACILNKITYPTGGYTEFDYQPHYYSGTNQTNLPIEVSAGEYQNTTDAFVDTQSVTPQKSGLVTVYTTCSNVTDGTPYFSRVFLRVQGETNASNYLINHYNDPYSNPDYTNPSSQGRLEKQFNVYLTAGVTYELIASSQGTSTSTNLGGAAFSMANFNLVQETIGLKMAGGLRVKEIRDYPSAGATPVTKIYKYGISESGMGTLLIPTDGLSSAKQEITFEYYSRENCSTCTCLLICRKKKLLVSGRPALELSTLNGSPVVYAEVAVYESSSNAPNGKQVFKFNVQEDTFLGTTRAYNNGRFQFNESWKGGDQTWNGAYIGNSSDPIKESSTTHSIMSQATAYGTKVGWLVQKEGCPQYSPSLSDFYYFDYPIYTGIKKLTASEEIQYTVPDRLTSIKSHTDYEYDDLGEQHQQLSRQITTNSSGQTLETNYWYPADYNSTAENISDLLEKNIIATPIKIEQHVNQKITSGKVNRFNADGKPYEVYLYEASSPQTPPVHDEETIIPAGYTKKIDIAYDATSKNTEKVQLSNSIATAYLWAYNQTYPIAKADYANPTQIAATSFEFTEKGNWTYSGSSFDNIKARTGKYYYKLSEGNITRSLTVGTYYLEYWTQGTVTVSGGTITDIPISAVAVDGWTHFRKKIKVTSTTTLTISGNASAFIDELRLYPAEAQIATYTYDPIYGISSQTDPAGITTTYEYDEVGRLKLIKDQDGNIVKNFVYHYKE